MHECAIARHFIQKASCLISSLCVYLAHLFVCLFTFTNFYQPSIGYDSRELLKPMVRRTNVASNEKSWEIEFEFKTEIDDHLRWFSTPVNLRTA